MTVPVSGDLVAVVDAQVAALLDDDGERIGGMSEMGWGEQIGRCPECDCSVTLKHGQIPSHVPKGSREQKLCAASGYFAAYWNQPGGDGETMRT